MLSGGRPLHRRQGGAIVNVATNGVDRTPASGRLAMYNSAKAAVIRYTQALAVELGPDGIRVNCISPGIIESARIKAQAASAIWERTPTPTLSRCSHWERRKIVRLSWSFLLPIFPATKPGRHKSFRRSYAGVIGIGRHVQPRRRKSSRTHPYANSLALARTPAFSIDHPC